jgi:hypothetical protein
VVDEAFLGVTSDTIAYLGGAVGDDAADDSKRMDVLLAEFSAIRTVIDRKQFNQISLTSLNLTVVATITGLVLSGKAHASLVLVLPIACSALGMFVLGQSHDQATAAAYIAERLRPLVLEQVADDRLFDWERFFREHKDFGYVAQAVALALLFPGIAITSLIIGLFSLTTTAAAVSWVLGFAITLVFVSVAAYAFRGRVKHFWHRFRNRLMPHGRQPIRDANPNHPAT